jgi:hypothetical protein
VWLPGDRRPSNLEAALARIMSSGRPADPMLAAVLYGLDGVVVCEAFAKRYRTAPVASGIVVVEGIACPTALQVIVSIAPLVDDLVWEQALESGLHKKLFGLEDVTSLVPLLTNSRTAGAPRIKRVLAVRPPGAPPTESLLETLTVQLARRTDGIPEPTRQLKVFDEHGEFVARVDLSWPAEGGFTELDGMHHKGQPVYDANRQTNVAIATGWLCGRFSWREVRWNPIPTGRRLARFIQTARRAPRRDS